MAFARSSLLSLRALPASICPTCAFAQAVSLAGAAHSISFPRRSNRSPRHPRRTTSTLASSTAVNATREIPASLRGLCNALEKLKKNAPNYVNLSRLQLALRSLESSRPTIRLAVLGLRNQKTARQLTRLLLADVLSEQGDWEAKINAFSEDDRRAILLRYGDESDPVPSNSQVMTLHVPSRILQRHNLEVLVSTLNISPTTPVGSADASELRRAALVPTAETPSSFAGGVSYLTYPVHRAIILGDGLEGCMTVGRYILKHLEEEGNTDVTIHLASNFPELSRGTDRDATNGSEVSITDVSLAEGAITKFRESLSNASIYERQWNESGLPHVTKWLSEGFSAGEDAAVDPAVKALISDLVEEVSQNVSAEEEARRQRLEQPITYDDARQPLNESLKVWAMRAHVELRDQLDMAFSSENWAKLRWWKLIWRVDDVAMISAELVERSWLVEAEKGIIWLAGRSAEAGLHDGVTTTLKLEPPPEESKTTSTTLETDSVSDSEPIPPSALPWPVQIPLARRALQLATIPTLQALAQALVIQTGTVAMLTTTLSVLVYVSFPAATLYSSGAIAALGVAWSLRRLQKTWEGARNAWEGEAREGGRVVLKDVEESFREMLRAGMARQADELSVSASQDGKLAREAVEDVRRALDGVAKFKAPQAHADT